MFASSLSFGSDLQNAESVSPSKINKF